MVIFNDTICYLSGTTIKTGWHHIELQNEKFRDSDIKLVSRFGDELDKKFWLKHEGDTIKFSKLPEGSMIVMAEG